MSCIKASDADQEREGEAPRRNPVRDSARSRRRPRQPAGLGARIPTSSCVEDQIDSMSNVDLLPSASFRLTFACTPLTRRSWTAGRQGEARQQPELEDVARARDGLRAEHKYFVRSRCCSGLRVSALRKDARTTFAVTRLSARGQRSDRKSVV